MAERARAYERGSEEWPRPGTSASAASNIALEPTCNSLRSSLAAAVARGSPRALGVSFPRDSADGLNDQNQKGGVARAPGLPKTYNLSSREWTWHSPHYITHEKEVIPWLGT